MASISGIESSGNSRNDFIGAMNVLRQDNYEQFVDDLNLLATDEKVAFLRDAIIDLFNDEDGLDVQFTKPIPIPIRELHPTQNEIDITKSLNYPLSVNPYEIDNAFSEKPILLKDTPLVVAEVNGEMYIIDGHHRWAQIYCLNPNAQMFACVIRSNGLFKTPDDVLKLVQMQIFIANDGCELPKKEVKSPHNLYTIDEPTFKDWCLDYMCEDAYITLSNHIGVDSDDVDGCIDYMWSNVLVMREMATMSDTAHNRGVMPQTNQVNDGKEFMKPKAQPLSEANKMEIPKNISGKLKNTPKPVDNFIFTQMLPNKRSFYVFAGKSKRRIYQGATTQPIQNIYFDGTCVVAICDRKTFIFGPQDMRYPLKNWRKIREF